ncbi:MAG TPA: hypothetical protein VK832_08800, partial [Burkholderiaceae bacterium]|nr:hypothetical protein [Burkholderiaceae bacterium]
PNIAAKTVLQTTAITLVRFISLPGFSIGTISSFARFTAVWIFAQSHFATIQPFICLIAEGAKFGKGSRILLNQAIEESLYRKRTDAAFFRCIHCKLVITFTL